MPRSSTTEVSVYLRANHLNHAALSNIDILRSNWDRKNVLNFPRPFYVGDSDSCGTGIEAKNNKAVYSV